jgi:catechol-2,3-dioxygenase
MTDSIAVVDPAVTEKYDGTAPHQGLPMVLSRSSSDTESNDVRVASFGHLALLVSDLELSERFYQTFLGLTTTLKRPGTSAFLTADPKFHHELALFAAPNAKLELGEYLRMHHFSWRTESFEDLRTLYTKLLDGGVSIKRITDHGIALSVYFFDPDGYTVEIYYELPPDQWVNHEEGTFPFSLTDER